MNLEMVRDTEKGLPMMIAAKLRTKFMMDPTRVVNLSLKLPILPTMRMAKLFVRSSLCGEKASDYFLL